MALRGIWLILALFLAGCMPPKLVYRPNPPAAKSPVLPLRVAVRPFKNDTNEPRVRAKNIIIPAVFYKLQRWYNLALGTELWPAEMPADLWEKAFAKDLEASGLFPEVFSGELPPDARPDVVIEGRLTRARAYNNAVMVVILPVYVSNRSEYAFTLRALRPGDRTLLWEGSFQRQVRGTNVEKAVIAMQSMMYEASQALVKGLEARRADWETAAGGRPGSAGPGPSSSGQSVEEILRSIGTQGGAR